MASVTFEAERCVAASEVGEVRRALDVLARHVSGGGRHRSASRAEWAGLVASCQAIANTATAVQDVAITRLAAIEEEWLEDGTTFESPRMSGHVALDAPDIVAGALGVSHVHAQRRVALAVRLVAGGGAGEDGDAAVGLEGRGVGAGLSVLHSAMADGRLDAYRAGVVADELIEVPAEVAEAVVGVLVPYLGVETPVQLRRRCRRALARISPDLLRQRAQRAREASGLRRWVEEPGVDRWEGTFPSEQAAEGWAAVDALARRYVAEGRCERVEAARARALMDLVRGQATIDVQLVVTVPADVLSDAAGVSDAARVSDAGAGAALRTDGAIAPNVDRASVASGRAGAPPGPASPDEPPPGHAPGAAVLPSEGSPLPEVGGGVLPSEPSPGDARISGGAPPARASRRVDAFLPGSPGGRVPAHPDCAGAETSTWPLTVGDERASVTSDDDLVEVAGPFPGDPVLVGRAWIRSFLRAPRTPPSSGTGAMPRRRWASSTVREECHPVTGALLGSAPGPGRAYRPGRRLAALVRARDGRCRFPGCSVAARFCDLDHVRPWPTGSTSAANLICLCRRHHRIKQRAGWAVRLHPDTRAVWTDPTGRVRTSWPRDLLHAVVLPAAAGAAGPLGAPAPAVPAGSVDLPSTAVPAGSVDPSTTAGRAGPVHPSVTAPNRAGPPVADASDLETLLEVLGEHLPTPPSCGRRATGAPTPWDVRVHVVAPDPHRRLLYAGAPRGHPPPGPHRHPGRRRRDAVGTGPPPF